MMVMVHQKKSILNDAVTVLVEHGWDDDEAEALISSDVENEHYKTAWAKVIDQVPEAAEYGLLFNAASDPDFVSNPELVQRRLGLSEKEMSVLAEAERLYAG